MIATTFILLALAIASVWIPPLQHTALRRLPPWLFLFSVAIICGFAVGVLQPFSLISLTAFTIFTWLGFRHGANRWQKITFGLLTMVIALALATHHLPGFNNPILFSGVQFAADSAPFTLYANFDKGAVGLVLLALCCRRTTNWDELRTALRKTIPVIAAILVLIPSLAVVMRIVRIDLKWPDATLPFLFVNLFFTVIAEEAFFRGLIQDRLSAISGSSIWKSALVVAIPAFVFGIAHLGGGVKYAALATLSGIGYGIAFQRTRRIESPICAHFVLNAAHFLILSYPFLRQG